MKEILKDNYKELMDIMDKLLTDFQYRDNDGRIFDSLEDLKYLSNRMLDNMETYRSEEWDKNYDRDCKGEQLKTLREIEKEIIDIMQK